MVNALKDEFKVLQGTQDTLPEEAVFQLRSEESGLGEEGGRGCGGGSAHAGALGARGARLVQRAV